MTGSSTGASIDTTTYCAILPSIVGISTSFTTLGKLQPTHAIPYLMKLDFSFRTILHIVFFHFLYSTLKKCPTIIVWNKRKFTLLSGETTVCLIFDCNDFCE